MSAKDTVVTIACVAVNGTRNVVANATSLVSDIGSEVGSSVVNVRKILYDKTYNGHFIGNVAYDGKKWLKKMLNQRGFHPSWLL